MSVSPNRNRVIDLLRGYFLFIIGVDHAFLNPNIWDNLSGQNILWVSAAEGFFFVSGLMVGLVRGRQIDKIGWPAVIHKLYHRAAVLYLWTVFLTIAFTLLGWWINDPTLVKGGIYSGDWWQMCLDAFSLRYVYGWTDFLPYYIAFLLISPVALWMVRHRLSLLVIVASCIFWLQGRQNSYLAWQILFICGIVAGYHWQTISRWAGQLSAHAKSVWTWTLYTASLMTLTISVLYVHMEPLTDSLPLLGERSWIDWATDKVTLGPGRLLLFALWFTTLYVLASRFEKQISKAVGWFVLPLGRNSLGTYIAQAVILYILKVVWPDDYGLIGNSLWVAIELLLVWGIVFRLSATLSLAAKTINAVSSKIQFTTSVHSD